MTGEREDQFTPDAWNPRGQGPLLRLPGAVLLGLSTLAVLLSLTI